MFHFADPEVCGAIGAGLRRGAELAGIEIPGGEIAQVGDIVSGWELGGSAIGLRTPARPLSAAASPQRPRDTVCRLTRGDGSRVSPGSWASDLGT